MLFSLMHQNCFSIADLYYYKEVQLLRSAELSLCCCSTVKACLCKECWLVNNISKMYHQTTGSYISLGAYRIILVKVCCALKDAAFAASQTTIAIVLFFAMEPQK